MSVFFCDSNCEIWHDKIKELGIKGIKMPYLIDDNMVYYDFGENTNFNEFYTKIKNGATPKTQALNSQDYIEYFEPVLASGEDILYVHFSSKMSGTFNYMQMAIHELLEKYPDRKITTVDTLSITMGAGLIVLEAYKMHKNGATDEEVKKWVEDNRQNFSLVFAVDDLNHLKRGGRLSSTSAFFGSLLNIKPLCRVSNEGLIETFQKVNGRKKALQAIINYFVENQDNAKNYPIVVMDALSPEDNEFLVNELKKIVGEEANIITQPIGPVIGSHCGANVVGIGFHAKQR